MLQIHNTDKDTCILYRADTDKDIHACTDTIVCKYQQMCRHSPHLREKTLRLFSNVYSKTHFLNKHYRCSQSHSDVQIGIQMLTQKRRCSVRDSDVHTDTRLFKQRLRCPHRHSNIHTENHMFIQTLR